MKLIDTQLPEVKLIEPQVISDDRGFFFESYNQKKFNEAIGRNVTFVQDNHSKSHHGVLRGLHYQKKPFAQAKLIRVTRGEVFDVAVDIRQGSHNFGKWVGTVLSAENKLQMWIPEGFAHGFLVLSEVVDFQYKTTEFWEPEYEEVIKWDDVELKINWPISQLAPIISKKDQNGKDLKQIKQYEA